MEKTVEVSEQSQVAEVRRVVGELAAAQGMSSVEAGRCALVATEASTNLVKYGKHGFVTASAFSEWGTTGVQIVAADKGPGFSNFLASARDGVSTGGSLGIGLGVIVRACDLFEVFTAPGQGSALLCRIAKGNSKPHRPKGALAIGSRRSPMRGQVECGDALSYTQAGGWQRLCVVDGLGHGPLAARAAVEAIAVVRAAPAASTPMEILARAHEALKATRGAVMAVAAIDSAAGRLSFAGVGNIAAAIYTADDTRHLLSVEGVVGYQSRTLKMEEHAWHEGCTLILSSDGVSTRWNPSRYPGLLSRHAMLIASVIHRDFARDSDDATLLVAKGKP
jgi:anti-sigma regulatory factor (Ser/Thr protein kinase)